MKPIECYADRTKCELCGAVRVDGEMDSGKTHEAAELLRRLAFIADKSPSIALLLIHRLAGRTEREIATKLHISQQAVHSKIRRAQKAMVVNA